jgi:hypothetical protein
VDPSACLDDMEMGRFLTVSGLEPRPLGHPARNQSLYRLSYRGSMLPICTVPTSVQVLQYGSRMLLEWVQLSSLRWT